MRRIARSPFSLANTQQAAAGPEVAALLGPAIIVDLVGAASRLERHVAHLGRNGAPRDDGAHRQLFWICAKQGRMHRAEHHRKVLAPRR